MDTFTAYYGSDDQYSVDVTVTDYYHQPPTPSSWDSPDDYYGYTEFDWEVHGDLPDWAIDRVEAQVERFVKGEL